MKWFSQTGCTGMGSTGSPDRSPLDIFLCGYFKKNVFQTTDPEDIYQLKTGIKTLITGVTRITMKKISNKPV